MSGRVSDLKVTNRLYCITQMIAVIAVLGACSSNTTTSATPPQPLATHTAFSLISDTVTGTLKGAYKAVQSPLEDIGLKRQSVPGPLKAIAANPYAVPQPPNCTTISTEIDTLDKLLGPDVVNKVSVTDNSSLSTTWSSAKNISWDNRDQYAQQGSSLIQQQAASTVQDRLNSMIPYRSWIRWVSGAESRARKLAQATEAGKLRRAFLKGYSTSMHCYADNDTKPAVLPLAQNTPAATPHAVEVVASAGADEE